MNNSRLSETEKGFVIFIGLILALAIAFGFACGLGWILQYVWNSVSDRPIRYWPATGIVVLAMIVLSYFNRKKS